MIMKRTRYNSYANVFPNIIFTGLRACEGGEDEFTTNKHHVENAYNSRARIREKGTRGHRAYILYMRIMCARATR